MLQEKERYEEPIRESLKALLALGWKLDLNESARSSVPKTAKQVMLLFKGMNFVSAKQFTNVFEIITHVLSL